MKRVEEKMSVKPHTMYARHSASSVLWLACLQFSCIFSHGKIKPPGARLVQNERSKLRGQMGDKKCARVRHGVGVRNVLASLARPLHTCHQ
jgi:hypothetical protein